MVDGDLQDRVLRTFHYALKPDGLLFLGPSEGVTRQAKCFAAVDRKHRIFQRKDVKAALPELASASRLSAKPQRTDAGPAIAGGEDRIARKARHAMEKYSPAWPALHHRTSADRRGWAFALSRRQKGDGEMTNDTLAGRRVLVVEDEMLIAMEIGDVLKALGCEVVGPAAKLEDALELSGKETFDAAILDVTIRGGQVFPVAEKLLERNIPFVLASRYGDWALPETMRDLPRLTKPFTATDLEDLVRFLCCEVVVREAGGVRAE
jgi:CheY-like chemotaxis protein